VVPVGEPVRLALVVLVKAVVLEVELGVVRVVGLAPVVPLAGSVVVAAAAAAAAAAVVVVVVVVVVAEEGLHPGRSTPCHG
jgi:hypothetical protein